MREAPTPAVRRMVANRRKYLLVAGALLVLAAAALVWAIASDSVGGLLLFPLPLMSALVLISLQVQMGLHIRDYDSLGRVRAPIAALPSIVMTVVAAAMVAIQVAVLSGGFDRTAVALLVASVLLVVVGASQVASVWRLDDAQTVGEADGDEAEDEGDSRRADDG